MTIYFNQGKPWSEEEMIKLAGRYKIIKQKGITDKDAFEILSKEFGRGRFSILNVLKKFGQSRPDKNIRLI